LAGQTQVLLLSHTSIIGAIEKKSRKKKEKVTPSNSRAAFFLFFSLIFSLIFFPTMSSESLPTTTALATPSRGGRTPGGARLVCLIGIPLLLLTGFFYTEVVPGAQPGLVRSDNGNVRDIAQLLGRLGLAFQKKSLPPRRVSIFCLLFID
jgi:hypothetical protein